jgi:hypothetical protein
MHTYAKIKDGIVVAFPYDYDTLCRDIPDTIFTGVIDIIDIFSKSDQAAQGYEIVEVAYPDRPQITNQQKTHRIAVPIFEDGQWIQKWIVEDMTIEEIIDSMKSLPSNPQ